MQKFGAKFEIWEKMEFLGFLSKTVHFMYKKGSLVFKDACRKKQIIFGVIYKLSGSFLLRSKISTSYSYSHITNSMLLWESRIVFQSKYIYM